MRTVAGVTVKTGGWRAVGEGAEVSTVGCGGVEECCSFCSSAGLFSSSIGGAGNVVMRLAAIDDIIGNGEVRRRRRGRR